MTLVREHFNQAQNEIEKRIIRFSSMISDTLHKAFNTVLALDLSEAKQIIEHDKLIDEEQHKIEEACVKILATEQPVASDLRSLVAYIKELSLYEKIGDYAKSMCINTEMVTKQLIEEYSPHIIAQRKIVFEMLESTIEALVKKDANLARDTAQKDNQLDKNYRATQRELLKKLDNNDIHHESIVAFINIIKCFERIGDMISIIDELIVYAANGIHEDLN